MGDDGRLYNVLQCRVVMLSRLVSGQWSSRWQGCIGECRASKSCGEDCVLVCALVHMQCARQDRFSEAPTARPTGFAVDVEDQDF